MNTETRDSISGAAEILRGHLSAIGANQAIIADVKAAAAILQEQLATIQATGRGPAGLPSLMAEIRSKNEQVERLGKTHDAFLQALNDALGPIYSLARTVLGEIYPQRVATIAALIRPYVRTDERAREIAALTDACSKVKITIGLSVAPRMYAADHARQILDVFDGVLLEA